MGVFLIFLLLEAAAVLYTIRALRARALRSAVLGLLFSYSFLGLSLLNHKSPLYGIMPSRWTIAIAVTCGGLMLGGIGYLWHTKSREMDRTDR